jgi:hypothetical protein
MRRLIEKSPETFGKEIAKILETTAWTVEERSKFFQGLKTYKKDFLKISRSNLLPKRDYS